MNELSLIETLQPTEKSLITMVNKYKNHMLKRASDNIRLSSPEKQDQFLMRTIASIVKNDKLKECFTSAEGRYSIFELVDNCLRTGLELEKHAYPIPYKKKIKRGNNDIWITIANFQIKRQGFHALLCGGLQPIFKDLRWSIVYEKERDNIKIDKASGEVVHPACLESDPGQIVGCWVQAIQLDDTKICNFFPIKYIHEIRDNHSKTYNDYLEKLEDYKNKKQGSYKPQEPAWLTDPIPMIEKTAIKAFCRPYSDVKEELANAYYSEGDEIILPKKPIEDVAEIIIDKALDNLDEAVNEKPKKEKTEKHNDNKKDDDDGILF